MGSFNKSFAGKKREAYRRTIRAYCPKITYKGSLVPPCYKCELIKGGKDCKGNPVGTRELMVSQAMAGVLELIKYKRPVSEHRVTFSDNTYPDKQKGETVK